MLKTQFIKGKNERGEEIDVPEVVLDRRSGEPIVTEDRQPALFRALPRDSKDRILGNPLKGIIGYTESKKWLPLYQTYSQGLMTGLKCWKCQRDIAGWMPALRSVAGGKPFEAEQILVGGKPAVRLTPHNHYREGLFRYRRPDGVSSEFSFLHCADCHISDADGPDLLACFLAGHDTTRTTLNLYDDDFWAQWMWRWSAIELVARAGDSKGPQDLMAEAERKGRG